MNEYPYVGKHTSGLIVLFTSKKVGYVLDTSRWRKYEVGDYRTDWYVENFINVHSKEEILNIIEQAREEQDMPLDVELCISKII